MTIETVEMIAVGIGAMFVMPTIILSTLLWMFV